MSDKRNKTDNIWDHRSILCIYEPQYSERYLIMKNYKCSSSSQVTGIPLTERQGLKDDLESLRVFSLQLGIGPNDRGLPF